MLNHRRHNSKATTSLRRWRTAAEPAPETSAPESDEDVFSKAVDTAKEEGKKEGLGEGTKPSRSTLLNPIIADLAKKAEAYLTKYKLSAEFDKDPGSVPFLEATGYDLTFRLLDPNLKGALLTFSWTKKEGLKSWISTLTGKAPDQITLYFCDGVYIATGAQADPFLKALATIQEAMMHASTPEEDVVYELLKKKKPAEDTEQQKQQQKDALYERLLATVSQLQANEPRLDTSNAGAVLEEAKDAYSANNITKQQFDELYGYIRQVDAKGWEELVGYFEGEEKTDPHKNVAFEASVTEAVTKLTDGRYKGKPEVGYKSAGGKNYAMAALVAPFPFHFRFIITGGGALTLDGAGARICQNDYDVKSDSAKDLLYAVLALGIANKQAAQTSDELKHRGKKRNELPQDQEDELEDFLGKISTKRRRTPLAVDGTLYKVVIDEFKKRSGKGLGPDTQAAADRLVEDTEVTGAELTAFWKLFAKDLGITLNKKTFQNLLKAVARENSPDAIGPKVDAAIKAMLGTA